MSLTTKNRKLISKTLIDLFSSREQELNAIEQERDDTLESYDTEDDSSNRELYIEPAKTVYTAALELPRLDNYYLNTEDENYKYLLFDTINLGNKLWSGGTVNRVDSTFLWSLLPDYNSGTRPQNLFNLSTLYSNLDYNSVDRGDGIDTPKVSGISFALACPVQINESSNDSNLTRIYEAFTDMKSTFISGETFIDAGIDFSSTSWGPVNDDITYIPRITFNSYGKLSSNAMTATKLNSEFSGSIGNSIPSKYVVCSSDDLSILKIAKVYTKSESKTSIPSGEYMTTYYWNYVINEARTISTLSSDSLAVNRRITTTDTLRVFQEMKAIYISEVTKLKNTLDGITTYYNSTNSLKESCVTFLNYLNSLVLSTASDVNSFYIEATNFNVLVGNRKTTLLGVLSNANYLDDIKNIITLRINKTDGTLLDIFRRIEAMDSTYRKYIKGGDKIAYYASKLVTTKVLEAPNNSYTLTIPKTLHSVYSSSFNVGDMIYILDDNKPEMKLQIIGVSYGSIDDEDNMVTSTDSASASTAKVQVKYLKCNRIISNDFDKAANLRIVKDLL